MEARSAHRRRRRPVVAGTLVCAGALALGACGNGPRQDENEPKGKFPVEVTRAYFPGDQKLAETSTMVISVRNAGDETIPNIAVTVRGFDKRVNDSRLADPSRPIFVLDDNAKDVGGFPDAKEAAPSGCETTYVDTWACGRLHPGAERTFRWRVTAVQAGPYALRWEVAAGLNGKAKAVDSAGRPPRGSFAGTVSNAAPKVRVADDGHTIVKGTR